MNRLKPIGVAGRLDHVVRTVEHDGSFAQPRTTPRPPAARDWWTRSDPEDPRALDAKIRALEAELAAGAVRLHGGAVRELQLRPAKTAKPKWGTAPIVFYEDQHGHKLVFKSVPVAQAAGDVLASRVRRLGGRPTLDVIHYQINDPERGKYHGILRPFAEGDGSVLDRDPTTWTPLQREVILREHPWEWLLQNLDTHAGQFVLSTGGYPLNIDWDHSFWLGREYPLDRFSKASVFIPPARNFLYDEYVHGNIELDFTGMLEQARAIDRLDDNALAPLFAEYAKLAIPHRADRAAFVEDALARKQTVLADFERFVADLQRERAQNLRLPNTPRRPLGEAVEARLRDATQRFGGTVQRSPIAGVGRKLLRSMRADSRAE